MAEELQVEGQVHAEDVGRPLDPLADVDHV
jgi:hypothetical protein